MGNLVEGRLEELLDLCVVGFDIHGRVPFCALRQVGVGELQLANRHLRLMGT
jgi:hypothetical protein